jgi:hypothetical protein
MGVVLLEAGDEGRKGAADRPRHQTTTADSEKFKGNGT